MCLEISSNLLLVLQDALKHIFSTNSRCQKMTQRHFFPTLHPLSTVIFATATVLAFVLLCDSRFNFHCYTQREARPTQKSARKCAATSCDVLRERLQSAFTLANQLRQIAQYSLCLKTKTFDSFSYVFSRQDLNFYICNTLLLLNKTINKLHQWY